MKIKKKKISILRIIPDSHLFDFTRSLLCRCPVSFPYLHHPPTPPSLSSRIRSSKNTALQKN